MAVPPTSPAASRKESAPSSAKRSKNPGIRVHGGRIYDPQNGKTCHQCRQKTMDFAAACKSVKGNKPCTIKFCHKCLLNRYGEKAEEVVTCDDWKCPKCRGVCNCSFCMKKKGEEPTGILVHRAKLTGFSSVQELLNHGGEYAENLIKSAPVSPNKSPAPKTGLVPSKRFRDKENCIVGKNGAISMKVVGATEKDSLAEKKQEKSSKKLKQMHQIESGKCDMAQVKDDLQIKLPGKAALPKAELNKENMHQLKKAENTVKAAKKMRRPVKVVAKLVKEDVVRPPGKPLTVVAGVELSNEDVGHALQFLEFCNVFAKVLAINKGEPEAIIRELVRGSVALRRSRNSAIIQFQIRLLSFILEDMGEESSLDTKGENSWLKPLGKFLKEARVLSRDVPLDFVNDTSAYNNLDSSKKLRILALLCDEALGTEAIRKFIDEENAKFAEKKKERMEHISDAKKKEKLAKEKLKADLAKSLLSTNSITQLSVSEHATLISKIRNETEKAHQEMLETVNLLPKNKQTADAVRTTPLFLEEDGLVFWRLKNYNGCSSIVLQDMEKWSSIILQDKWFFFEDEAQEAVEKYISSLRSQRARREKDSLKIAKLGSVEIKHDSFDNSEAHKCLVEGISLPDVHLMP